MNGYLVPGITLGEVCRPALRSLPLVDDRYHEPRHGGSGSYLDIAVLGGDEMAGNVHEQRLVVTQNGHHPPPVGLYGLHGHSFPSFIGSVMNRCISMAAATGCWNLNACSTHHLRSATSFAAVCILR